MRLVRVVFVFANVCCLLSFDLSGVKSFPGQGIDLSCVWQMGDLAAQRKNVAREYRDDGEKTADHCKSLLTEIWRD